MNAFKKPGKLIFIVSFFISIPTFGQVRLPKLLSDGMVLQRDTDVKIWGWAADNENISVSINDSVYHTSANDNGERTITLSDLKAGGPHMMTINASNSITIKDILIGDVWVCSGQSNMELPMKRVSPVYEAEIANSETAYIRHFVVPQKYNFNTPQHDF